MRDDILMILDSIEREKGIPKEVLFSAIESALVSAARKILGNRETDVTVTIDRETGQIKVASEGKEIKSNEFGRIAAQTAKQVIIQKIREAEREVIFDDYHNRVGGIVTGAVHRFERGNIVVDLGKTEAILPKSQQCPNERYKQGDRIRAYVLEVTKTSRGPQIVLSRSDATLVKKLFELEVPEIPDGIVEIKSISREPGERTKMAVRSKDDKIDPVGACVGMRGNRVKDIVRELHGEKIDIVRWNENVEEYLKAALSPAQIFKTKIDKEKKLIEVIVKNDQLSIAIGKHGQNVRLASRLIGWELDIRGVEEPKPEKVKEEPQKEKKTKKRPKGVPSEALSLSKGEAEGKAPSIKSLDGVGKKAQSVLSAAGFDSVEKIAASSVEDLVKLEGVGKKTAEKIINSAKITLGKNTEKSADKKEEKPTIDKEEETK
ncbi:MAG: transcription termination/antitermination protein NusA [Candidatus Omnitrophica bacterium]|nr:transcription termination/antitermination protein NusA [Candidatus Omnitrophota bacterium]